MAQKIVTILIILLFSTLDSSSQLKPIALSEKDVTDIKQQLSKFDRGNVSLEELTEKGGAAFDRKLASYYLAHTNEISTKSLLPIARCFAFFGDNVRAAALAKRYVQAYSNDWHGWRIMGSANLALTNLAESLTAFTNAVRLGDHESCTLLSLTALKLSRLDIVKGLLPCLFNLKESATNKSDRTDAIFIIVAYAANENREDLFVEALAKVRPEDIAARSDLAKLVTELCDRFQTKELQNLCQTLKAKRNE